MTGILHFETFLLTGILLNITPGNDTIFILSRSIAQGREQVLYPLWELELVRWYIHF
ncbi:hypothetical protein [Pedobacter sp. NJ-S-72]